VRNRTKSGRPSLGSCVDWITPSSAPRGESVPLGQHCAMTRTSIPTAAEKASCAAYSVNLHPQSAGGTFALRKSVTR